MIGCGFAPIGSRVLAGWPSSRCPRRSAGSSSPAWSSRTVKTGRDGPGPRPGQPRPKPDGACLGQPSAGGDPIRPSPGPPPGTSSGRIAQGDDGPARRPPRLEPGPGACEDALAGDRATLGPGGLRPRRRRPLALADTNSAHPAARPRSAHPLRNRCLPLSGRSEPGKADALCRFLAPGDLGRARAN